MEIRPETASDYAAIADLLAQAFGQTDEAILVDRIRRSPEYLPQLTLVAEVDGAIGGHILVSQVRLVGENSRPILALAPLAVRPSHQRQGIGKALVKAALDIASTRPEPLVVVLGHPDYYPRFGFQPASQYGIQAPFAVPDEAFMVRWLKPVSDRDQGIVQYPEAFDIPQEPPKS
jgi:putative acetyltransferase